MSTRSRQRLAVLVPLAAITLAACASPQPRETKRRGAERFNEESGGLTCPRCQRRIGAALGEPDAAPPAEGEQMLQGFLTEVPSSPERGDRPSLGLTIVVGAPGQLVNQEGADLRGALALQRARVRKYLTALREREGVAGEDELRKQMLAWALCVCPRDRRCQGGEEECVRCGTCA